MCIQTPKLNVLFALLIGVFPQMAKAPSLLQYLENFPKMSYSLDDSAFASFLLDKGPDGRTQAENFTNNLSDQIVIEGFPLEILDQFCAVSQTLLCSQDPKQRSVGELAQKAISLSTFFLIAQEFPVSADRRRFVKLANGIIFKGEDARFDELLGIIGSFGAGAFQKIPRPYQNELAYQSAWRNLVRFCSYRMIAQYNALLGLGENLSVFGKIDRLFSILYEKFKLSKNQFSRALCEEIAFCFSQFLDQNMGFWSADVILAQQVQLLSGNLRSMHNLLSMNFDSKKPECGICLFKILGISFKTEPFCSHGEVFYHLACLENLKRIEKGRPCPFCRKPFDLSIIFSNTFSSMLPRLNSAQKLCQTHKSPRSPRRKGRRLSIPLPSVSVT